MFFIKLTDEELNKEFYNIPYNNFELFYCNTSIDLKLDICDKLFETTDLIIYKNNLKKDLRFGYSRNVDIYMIYNTNYYKVYVFKLTEKISFIRNCIFVELGLLNKNYKCECNDCLQIGLDNLFRNNKINNMNIDEFIELLENLFIN